MSHEIKRTGSIIVVFPEGELLRESSEEITEMVESAIEAESSAVILSFLRVTALLSEGIRCMVALRDMVDKSGAAFHITDLPPDVKYTLKITNLLEFLGHIPSLEQCGQTFHFDPDSLEPVKISAKAQKPADDSPPPQQKSEGAANTQNPAPESTPPKKTAEPAPKPTKPSQKAKEYSDDELKKLISRHLPGRLAVEIVEFFIRHHQSVASLETLAEAVGAKPKVIHKMADNLVQRGVLKEIGEETFNFAPDAELLDQIEYFAREWHNPKRQPRLLAMLLSVER